MNFLKKFITFIKKFSAISGQHRTVRSVHRFFMRAKIWFKSTICPVAHSILLFVRKLAGEGH